MKEKRYYIAYGSNLNVPQMRMRCPHATILGTANLKGWELSVSYTHLTLPTIRLV